MSPHHSLAADALSVNLRDTLFEPGHRHILFHAGNQPSDGALDGATGRETRNIEA